MRLSWSLFKKWSIYCLAIKLQRSWGSFLTNFYYKPLKRVANRNLDYRRNFINTSFMGNSNRMCKGKTNLLDSKWHITESVPLQWSKCFPNSQVTSYYLCVLSGWGISSRSTSLFVVYHLNLTRNWWQNYRITTLCQKLIIGNVIKTRL